MSLVSSILAEIEQESRTTRKVLERVPDDKLGWSPHAKSMTLGRLASHIAAVPARVLLWLRAGEFDLAQAGPGAGLDQTAAIVAEFEKNMQEIREYLVSIDDSALKETFTLRKGDKTITTMTKMGIVRAVLLNHTYHHRGQLSVYLRLLEVPLPPIYGPTADEQM